MVCLGNICRSPLAEGILKSKLDSKTFLVDSAGTSAYHAGELPDKRSIEVAKKHGLDITYQKARQFMTDDFEIFDEIFVMDKSNYHNVIKKAKNDQQEKKVKMILNESFPNQNKEVPDPYHGGKVGFENVYQMLDEACEIIAKRL